MRFFFFGIGVHSSYFATVLNIHNIMSKIKKSELAPKYLQMRPNRASGLNNDQNQYLQHFVHFEKNGKIGPGFILLKVFTIM